jgi:hypothetical protein
VSAETVNITLKESTVRSVRMVSMCPKGRKSLIPMPANHATVISVTRPAFVRTRPVSAAARTTMQADIVTSVPKGTVPSPHAVVVSAMQEVQKKVNATVVVVDSVAVKKDIPVSSVINAMMPSMDSPTAKHAVV